MIYIDYEMRFGKKLALMSEGVVINGTQRPFISHRHLKELLSSVVRDLRGGCTDVSGYVERFRQIIDEDLLAVRNYVLLSEGVLSDQLASLRREAESLGIMETTITMEVMHCVQGVFSSPCRELHECIGENLKSVWIILSQRIARLADEYCQVAITLQSLAAYCDLNIAGFRKLVKQFIKQVPPPHASRIMDKAEYSSILCGVASHVSQAELLRGCIQASIDCLSPGVAELKRVRLGNETLLAIGAAPNEAENHCKSAERRAPAVQESTDKPPKTIAGKEMTPNRDRSYC